VPFLYAGVVVFLILAAFTARSIWLAWQARSGEARAAAVFDLVGQRTPMRPTDAPGAMAWLRVELERYASNLTDTGQARLYRELAGESDRVPGALSAVGEALDPPNAPSIAVAHLGPALAGGPSLRRQRVLEVGGDHLVVTRRRDLDSESLGDESASNRFVRDMSVLPALKSNVERALAPGAARHLPRPVRIYAVSEDGTLVSLPWSEAGSDASPREMALLSARAGLPAFAPQEFFFRFSADGDRTARPAYSGFYLDLGGRGLVSTILQPRVLADGQHAVVALDLAFDVDWLAFAEGIAPPVVGTAVTAPPDAGWSTLESALDSSPRQSLKSSVSELAASERQSGAAGNTAPLRHGVVAGRGALAAFQVADRTWLLMLFPQTAPAFPLAAVALLGGMLAVLLAGFEVNRRRADVSRRTAERALAEKQNLLNTMQVPLVVVDPNSDVIVSSNRAASSMGIRAGRTFGDLVWPDAAARAHYQKMQVASPEPRRAYGVPVAVPDESGVLQRRYAVIRSVAVTAPIEALAADERHRLGVLFLLDRDDDLALLASEIEDGAHRDERRRLAGLLSHGVDTLARVLEHCLGRAGDVVELRDFTSWLAEYLERRITVAAWLLDHWDVQPPLPPESVVDVGQARATIERFERMCRIVRDDRELRSRLHWDNGSLAVRGFEGSTVRGFDRAAEPVFDVRLDWPESFEFTTPVRGAFGWFLGEVLTNAVRHGAPGSTPVIEITCDRVRKELVFTVANAVSASAAGPRTGDAYGGLAILKAMARLLEWRELRFDAGANRFEVSWRVQAGERRQGDAD